MNQNNKKHHKEKKLKPNQPQTNKFQVVFTPGKSSYIQKELPGAGQHDTWGFARELLHQEGCAEDQPPNRESTTPIPSLQGQHGLACRQFSKDRIATESTALCTIPWKHSHGKGKISRKTGAAGGTGQAVFLLLYSLHLLASICSWAPSAGIFSMHWLFRDPGGCHPGSGDLGRGQLMPWAVTLAQHKHSPGFHRQVLLQTQPICFPAELRHNTQWIHAEPAQTSRRDSHRAPG